MANINAAVEARKTSHQTALFFFVCSMMKGLDDCHLLLISEGGAKISTQPDNLKSIIKLFQFSVKGRLRA